MATQTSGQALQLPNRPPSNRKHKTALIEINSRDRNYTNLIASNPFKFSFATPLKDVRAVELIGGTIPAQPFNILTNTFLFEESIGYQTFKRTISIPQGYYTTDTLLAILPGLLQGTVTTYTATLISGKLVITQTSGNDIPFALLFLSSSVPDEFDRVTGALVKMNTPATLLGFDISDYYSTSNIIESPFPIDLSTINTRLYLHINLENTQNLGCIERGSGRQMPFAIIYLDKDTNGYKFLNKETITPVSYTLPQPISRLQTLTVDFRDEFYRLVNFNGKDFTLLLQVTQLE